MRTQEGTLPLEENIGGLPPAFSLGPEECDCDSGMPWWFWFILGNVSWMTIRYVIKNMKESEEEKEEVASLLDEEVE